MPADTDKTVVMGPRSDGQTFDPDKTTRMDNEFATSVISPHSADETVQLHTREERIAAAASSSEPDLSGLDIPADLVVDEPPVAPAPAAQQPVSYVAKAPEIPKETKKPRVGRIVLIVLVVLLVLLVLYTVFINPYFLMNIEYLTWKNIGQPLSGPLGDFAAQAQRGALSWVNDIAVWVKGLL